MSEMGFSLQHVDRGELPTICSHQRGVFIISSDCNSRNTFQKRKNFLRHCVPSVGKTSVGRRFNDAFQKQRTQKTILDGVVVLEKRERGNVSNALESSICFCESI